MPPLERYVVHLCAILAIGAYKSLAAFALSCSGRMFRDESLCNQPLNVMGGFSRGNKSNRSRNCRGHEGPTGHRRLSNCEVTQAHLLSLSLECILRAAEGFISILKITKLQASTLRKSPIARLT